ncbi:cobalt ECF transporter T component CbiQ [Candidatus Electronema sp. PJ]|uniref:cobalt ECF transporter T component CbiQ n=1 Tax=Candidatus Electronema sp. PJ TaxID=3401572 RepID=UPI003AA88B18
MHRAAPHSKLLGAGILTLSLALSQQHLRTAFAGLALAVLLTSITKLSWTEVVRRLFLVNSFNLFLWIILPLTYGKGLMIRLIGLPVSLDGLFLAALITLKANAAVLFFISLLATSTVAQLGHGLQRLHVSQRLCLLLLFAYRYLFLIHEELLRLHRAAELRCFQPRTNLHTYKTYGYLLGMVIVRSWNRAARIQQAMLLRGFTGTFHSLEIMPKLRHQDILLMISLLLAAAGLVALDLIEYI